MSIATGCPPVKGRVAEAKPPAVVMAFPYMV
jgi:hypothetical protein